MNPANVPSGHDFRRSGAAAGQWAVLWPVNLAFAGYRRMLGVTFDRTLMSSVLQTTGAFVMSDHVRPCKIC